MNRKKFLILLVIVLIPLIPLVLLLTGIIRRSPPNVPGVTLRYWSVFDSEANVKGIMDAYRAKHPYVRFEFKVVDFDTYADELIGAWARDQGPDILSLPNTWVGGYTEFLTPLPAQYRVWEYSERQGFLRKQTELRQTAKNGLDARQLQRDYVDVVAPDVIRQSAIYGLPFSMDSLVVYYNKELLTRAKIIEPPKTWEELRNLVPKLTVTDPQGNVIRSAIGLGTGKNVTRSPDILSLLMLQNGAQMVDASGRTVTFHQAAEEGINRGEQAVSFYTGFADPNKEVYSWNANQPESFDAFVAGKIAFFIGYGYHKPLIDAENTPLQYGIAPMFHINADGTDAAADQFGNPKAVDYATYWVETVAKKSANPAVAWDFIQFAAAAGRVESYLEKTGKVAALRSILSAQLENLDLGVQAGQALTATSWYHGNDALKVEQHLRDMADAITAKTASVSEAVDLAARQIQQTLPGR